MNCLESSSDAEAGAAARLLARAIRTGGSVKFRLLSHDREDELKLRVARGAAASEWSIKVRRAGDLPQAIERISGSALAQDW